MWFRRRSLRIDRGSSPSLDRTCAEPRERCRRVLVMAMSMLEEMHYGSEEALAMRVKRKLHKIEGTEATSH